MSGPLCDLCGRPIDEPKAAWRQMKGWVSPRGAKSMTGAEQTGRLAHAVCIVAIREHVDPHQLTLHDYGLVEPGVER